jgi:predicted choloylglycine hydrolase
VGSESLLPKWSDLVTISHTAAVPLTLYGINEPVPGPRWQALFDATWPAYRTWYLSHGDRARPPLAEAERMLRRHLPELAGTWESLVELAGDDDVAARFLTLWNPPAFLPGCSQVALADPEPALARNYDYSPDLFECVVYSSAFTGRRVIGTGDCLWGLLDGMNDAGLAISLAFGGRRGSGSGFAIPLVVRYLLETAETVGDAVRRLHGLPVNMAYNLTMADAAGRTATAFVAPDQDPEISTCPVATNHRGRVPEDPQHARRFHSVERQQHLLGLLDVSPSPMAIAAALLRPPLHQTAYAQAFGTLYTVLYRPQLGYVDYLWPDTSWRRRFDSPEQVRTVVLRPA